jgi:hypothetical protein
MRAMLIIGTLLGLALPLGFAKQPTQGCTTLVIEYVGPNDSPAFPIVISTSSKEGEWYEQRLFKGPIRSFANIELLPAPKLNEITDLPSLRSALAVSSRTRENSKATPILRLVAGRGQKYVQVVLDRQTSLQILQDIIKRTADYPELRNEIQELESAIEALAAWGTDSGRAAQNVPLNRGVSLG